MALTSSAISVDSLASVRDCGAAEAPPSALLFAGTTRAFVLTRAHDEDADGMRGTADCGRCAALRSAVTAWILLCVEAYV